MKDISQKDKEGNLRLVSSSVREDIIIGNRTFGDKDVLIAAGPCAVESKEQIFRIAEAVKRAGATLLRGGVYKPLTFPYGDPLLKADRDSGKPDDDSSRVLSEAERLERALPRLEFLRDAGKQYDLPIVSEILYGGSVKAMEPYVDMFQVGYRHMFNVDLVEQLSKTEKPVLLKRHYGESLRSWLGIVEHFFARGKRNIMLCERGVSTPHTHNPESRSTIDIQVIPALREYAPGLRVLLDPSHSTFRRSYVSSVSRAAIAAGADGLLIDVHYEPETAWVDPLQALDFDAFNSLMKDVTQLASLFGKTM